MVVLGRGLFTRKRANSDVLCYLRLSSPPFPWLGDGTRGQGRRNGQMIDVWSLDTEEIGSPRRTLGGRLKKARHGLHVNARDGSCRGRNEPLANGGW